MSYEYEPHSFTRKLLHWRCCSKCGLIPVKNEFTQWAIAKGCNNEDHPDYKSKRSLAGKR